MRSLSSSRISRAIAGAGASATLCLFLSATAAAQAPGDGRPGPKTAGTRSEQEKRQPIATAARTVLADSTQVTPPQTRVDASGGGVTISWGNNSLTIGALMQFRWTLEHREQADADAAGEGVGVEDDPLSQFDVPRMRVKLSGSAYRPWMRYSFQFDFSRTSGEGASKIKDAIFEIRPADRSYRVALGQFKAPFGLQQLTSFSRQQFVDRAITDGKYTPGRDMGVMFAATAAARRIGFEAGIFNGSGESIRQTTALPLVASRFFINPLGPYELAEGATDAGAGPVMHLGIGTRTGRQIRGRTATGVFTDADRQTALNGEFAFKALRFYSTAEYFWQTEEQQNPVAGPDIESRGYHAQVGFMAVPRVVEAGIRYAEVNGDTGVPDSNLREIRGVVGYFWRAHNLKVQADVGQLRYEAGFPGLTSRTRAGLPGLGTRLVTGQALADWQVRVQVQVVF
jgi:hypothetical protein